VAMAPSLRTRMQNNLGQIKPVVFSVFSSSTVCKSEEKKKVKESGMDAFNLCDVFVTATSVTQVTQSVLSCSSGNEAPAMVAQLTVQRMRALNSCPRVLK